MLAVFAAEQDRYVDDLAYHFFEAEAWYKAFPYALRAGEQAHMLQEALSTVRLSVAEWSQKGALAGLVPYLEEKLLPEALAIARPPR